MRRPHLYALTAAITLTATLVMVVGGEPASEPDYLIVAEVKPSGFRATTTTLSLQFSAEDEKSLVLSAVEVELTEEAANRSTTTTATSTTTTTPVKKTTSFRPKTTTTTPATTAPTTTSPTTPPTTIKAEYRSDFEGDFHGRINSLRSANGLPGLSRNGSLDSRARSWAKTMAESGSLKHSNISSLVPPWSSAAENVGKGGSVSSIFGLLKGSGGHYANMVGDYTDVGIGVWRDSSGTLWTVHVFAR